VLENYPSMPVEFLRQGLDRRLWGSFVGWLESHEWSDNEIAYACAAAEKVFAGYLASIGRLRTSGDVLEYED